MNQGMIPLPMFFPQGQQQHDQAPPRVQVALAFLRHCTAKQSAAIAVNDIAIEEFPGQTLTMEEKAAHAQACRMLAGYFNGSLNIEGTEHPDRKGRLLNCPNCGGTGPGRAGCVLCTGSGSVMIYPAG